jgi:5'-nucleotidase
VERAEALIGPRVSRVVGTAKAAITRSPTDSGETALGNLVTDAQRASTGADIALTNQGGIRADLEAGELTWGELFTVQPFGNDLIELQLTGAQLRQLLEQQWQNPESPRMLQVSGLSYVWRPSHHVGGRVAQVLVNGSPLEHTRAYSVVVNSFMANGGDLFQGGTMAQSRVTRGSDLNALVAYVQAQYDGVYAGIEGRIVRLE